MSYWQFIVIEVLLILAVFWLIAALVRASINYAIETLFKAFTPILATLFYRIFEHLEQNNQRPAAIPNPVDQPPASSPEI